LTKHWIKHTPRFICIFEESVLCEYGLYSAVYVIVNWLRALGFILKSLLGG
jgi:hypothetical protein